MNDVDLTKITDELRDVLDAMVGGATLHVAVAEDAKIGATVVPKPLFAELVRRELVTPKFGGGKATIMELTGRAEIAIVQTHRWKTEGAIARCERCAAVGGTIDGKRLCPAATA